jgi:hypothetical protein
MESSNGQRILSCRPGTARGKRFVPLARYYAIKPITRPIVRRDAKYTLRSRPSASEAGEFSYRHSFCDAAIFHPFDSPDILSSNSKLSLAPSQSQLGRKAAATILKDIPETFL